MFSGQRVPILDVFRLLGQFGTGGDDSHLPLALGRLLPSLVPALVELAFVLVRPLLGNVVWRVDGAGCIVHEERLVRRHRLLSFHPVDRLVGHVHGEVIALRMRRGDPGDAVIDQRIPLIRFARSKGPETLVSQAAVSCHFPKAPVL